MIAKAKSSHIRVSPVKLRQVLDLIRGKDIRSAANLLLYAEKGCCKIVGKVLNSAVSNAKQKGLTEEQLFISKIFADQGPSWKRWRAASFGRATGILKKTSHLTIELDLRVDGVAPVSQPAEAVVEEPKAEEKAESKPKRKAAVRKTPTKTKQLAGSK